MRTSIAPWRATSAAARPTCASAKPSTRRQTSSPPAPRLRAEAKEHAVYLRNIASLAPGGAELTRRQFLKLTTLAGSGLTLGLLLPGCGRGAGTGAATAPDAPLVMPFVHIAPDNSVTVLCKHLECGQGVWTGLPAVVAEEL